MLHNPGIPRATINLVFRSVRESPATQNKWEAWITVINTGQCAIKLSCAANLIKIEYMLTNAIAYPHNMDLTLTLYIFLLAYAEEEKRSSPAKASPLMSWAVQRIQMSKFLQKRCFCCSSSTGTAKIMKPQCLWSGSFSTALSFLCTLNTDLQPLSCKDLWPLCTARKSNNLFQLEFCKSL